MGWLAGFEMFAKLRQGLLLYVLIIVAATTWLTQDRSRSWQTTLWVDVFPINGDGSQRAQQHIAKLDERDFQAIEPYIEKQAKGYGVQIERPLRINLGPTLNLPPPKLARDASPWQSILWSIQTRWWSIRVTWGLDRPTPDIKVFAVYYDGDNTLSLDRSAALQKGMVAIANLFADRRMAGSNRVVLTHELLHTLGATDKYEPGTNQPLYPAGYAEPDRKPLHPQIRAEIMAGRVAESPTGARIPRNLAETLIGEQTASEIGWR